eukprot:m.25012 g.25012  ORF g.25012 m.25012 type:complete len:513 (-) comp7665_c0_seq1:245-1783(-)
MPIKGNDVLEQSLRQAEIEFLRAQERGFEKHSSQEKVDQGDEHIIPEWRLDQLDAVKEEEAEELAELAAYAPKTYKRTLAKNLEKQKRRETIAAIVAQYEDDDSATVETMLMGAGLKVTTSAPKPAAPKVTMTEKTKEKVKAMLPPPVKPVQVPQKGGQPLAKKITRNRRATERFDFTEGATPNKRLSMEVRDLGTYDEARLKRGASARQSHTPKHRVPSISEEGQDTPSSPRARPQLQRTPTPQGQPQRNSQSHAAQPRTSQPNAQRRPSTGSPSPQVSAQRKMETMAAPLEPSVNQPTMMKHEGKGKKIGNKGKEHPWNAGVMDRHKCEEFVASCMNGDYLVRKSGSSPGYVLCVNDGGKPVNYTISVENGGFKFTAKLFNSLEEVIKFALSTPLKSVTRPGQKLNLNNPAITESWLGIKIGREECEKKVANANHGDFMVRLSSKGDKYVLVVNDKGHACSFSVSMNPQKQYVFGASTHDSVKTLVESMRTRTFKSEYTFAMNLAKGVLS